MKKISKKHFAKLSIIVTLIFLLQATLFAEAISNRTGTVKITKPDGSVFIVTKDQALPDIPSGSTVEILDGSAYIAPADALINLVVGNSISVIEAGDRVSISFDPATGDSVFRVSAGEITVTTGNTKTTIRAGQAARINFDEGTGTAEIRSLAGDIDTETAGVKAMLTPGAAAIIRADAATRTISIESADGMIRVVGIDGSADLLAKGESIETPASDETEITSYAEEKAQELQEAREEPAEPDRSEGSAFTP